MIKIGMMLGDRYEILEKIGTGGMSDVYKAKDHKLNRNIAVKVLKQEFSENNNFVNKFRTEAQAAAGLMHPNIVNVYDVGSEGGIHYIVMELVEGITLKKYIEKKVRLSAKEAVSIAIQISNGIEAAHNNHIIHRDIKPQNTIISKEGKVKVTDFGIAKAATNNTVSSNVMGSVHYTSPEQARGGFSDERSDIYSLGITMFEMLTGRVPFNGDTTVAIAIKHIQEALPYPSDYADDIPYSVEQIVLKCCQKSPDRRYQSMGEVIADLKKSLVDPEGDFVRITDPDEDAATRNITDDDVKKIRNASAERADLVGGVALKEDIEKEERERRKKQESSSKSGSKSGSSKSKSKSGSKSGSKSPKTPVRTSRDATRDRMEKEDFRRRRYEAEKYDDDPYDEDEDDEDDDEGGVGDRLTTVLVVVGAVIVGLVVLLILGRVTGFIGGSGAGADETEESAGTVITMPDGIVGAKLDDAKKVLIDLGLTPQIEYETSLQYEEGTVISASVPAGSELAEGDTVVLTVAQSTDGVLVPAVTGLSQAEARSNLEQHGFQVSILQAESATVEKGNVISQSPEGDTYAPAGSTIMITVSSGGTASDKISVPSVIGKSEMDAMAILTESGLNMGTISETNNDDPSLEGNVCYQSVAAGSFVDKGTVVDLRVSIGPKSATYHYSGSITAPTEDPEYQSGMFVQVMITTADGTSLLSTTTTSFPLDVNYTGINSATGTVTYIFTVSTEEVTVTDPETGETTTTPAQNYEKTVTRELTFEAE
ncbi:MAG: Stk1 family PASTA domain-containing Ser/Thr kinase [Lachnospiraceae bacterium]|nr:Stk1 family PASTA domain-containing Ser/Thr kinase [Lachnospiraceae bacterium]